MKMTIEQRQREIEAMKRGLAKAYPHPSTQTKTKHPDCLIRRACDRAYSKPLGGSKRYGLFVEVAKRDLDRYLFLGALRGSKEIVISASAYCNSFIYQDSVLEQYIKVDLGYNIVYVEDSNNIVIVVNKDTTTNIDEV